MNANFQTQLEITNRLLEIALELSSGITDEEYEELMDEHFGLRCLLAGLEAG